MRVSREEQRFPTRNYPYHRGAAAGPAAAPAAPPQPNTLYRRVIGLDQEAHCMQPDELVMLADPLGRLLRSGQPFPLSLSQLLQALTGLDGTPEALPDQLVFLVADGGHIPWTPETDTLQRSFRFVVARGRGEFTLLVSASTAIASEADGAFLQIIGWDAAHEVFHYYERLQGTFFWAGMSPHALASGTRGKGPFDSHVNGSMVMKELRAPWIHWHAPQAGINAEALAPHDPLRHEPLFQQRVTAERLETEVVRPGIRRWNDSRVRKAVGEDGVWRDIRHFLRQVVMDTTVNLASSETVSHLVMDDVPLRPPLSFFINRDTLFDTLGLVPGDPVIAEIVIPGRLYRDCLRRYDVHRSDGSMRVEGDVQFAFLTPEPAFEDTQLAEAMIRKGLLSKRFLAALSMMDFSNPVFSGRRAALLHYVPEEARGADPPATMEAEFVEALRKAIAGGANGTDRPDCPEQEFLVNWETPDFENAFIARITAYFAALRSGMADPDVVDGWFRLAEFRRRRFRRRPLAEFALTTPLTNIAGDAPPLRMNEEGRAVPVT